MPNPIVAGVISGVGGIISSNNQADAIESAAENQGAPWSGLQPYLTNKPIPDWLSVKPTPSQDWSNYITSLNTGQGQSWNNPAPPMFGFEGMQPGQGWSPYDNPNAPRYPEMPDSGSGSEGEDAGRTWADYVSAYQGHPSYQGWGSETPSENPSYAGYQAWLQDPNQGMPYNS